MAAQEPKELQPVAYLHFRHGDDSAFVGISKNDELDIGRQDVQAYFGVQERSISNHHIRIHCVAYEEEECRVAPLVYMRVLSSNAITLQRHHVDEPCEGILVTKGYGDVLLNHGDRVLLTKQIVFDFTDSSETSPPHLGQVQEAEVEKFADRYYLTDRVLGIGGQAAVYVAVKQLSGQQFACKIVDLGLARHKLHNEFEGTQDRVAREYNVLKRLSHPNIITLEKVFRTSQSIYIFQELITGGDLLSYLDKTGKLSEPQAAVIIRQLLEAVKYLHSNNIVHRDIKPENILMTCWRDGGRVVLSDFGQSRTATELDNAAKKAGVFRMQSKVGTYGYTAPEVFFTMKRDLEDGSGYSKAIDIWSIGCVTTTLLTNDCMFPNKKELEVGSINQHLKVLDGGPIWDEVGHRAKAFVRACLAIDEMQRPTAEECLQLAWFQHPHYQAEFDALYERSIAYWKPKKDGENIIEFLDIDDIALQDDAHGEADTRSRHFPVLRPTTLTADPRNSAQVQSLLSRSRMHHGPTATTAVAQQSLSCGAFRSLSSYPEPPSYPSSITMSRAIAMQRQYASGGTIETQVLPAPPKLSEFDNLDLRLRLPPHSAVHASLSKQKIIYR